MEYSRGRLIAPEESATYEDQKIDKAFLENKIEDFDQYFYICGPREMVDDVIDFLTEFGASEDRIVHEEAA